MFLTERLDWKTALYEPHYVAEANISFKPNIYERLTKSSQLCHWFNDIVQRPERFAYTFTCLVI